MKVAFSKRAYDDLSALDSANRRKIIKKFETIESGTKPRLKKLTNHGAYRLRVGDYRVICDIKNDVLFVIFISKRDSAYKSL